MTLNISLIKDRCFFKPFNQENDKNLKTGRAGLKYCYNQFLGAIFNLLGLTFSMKGKMNGKKFTVYIYKKSLYNWIERHANDPVYEESKIRYRLFITDNLNIIINKISNKEKFSIKKHINEIVDNCKNNNNAFAKRNINPGKPLSKRQIIDKAKEDNNIKYQREIRDFIEKKLSNYDSDISKGIIPYFYDSFTYFEVSSDENSKNAYNRHKDVKFIALEFLNSLPGVDFTPYKGYKSQKSERP